MKYAMTMALLLTGCATQSPMQAPLEPALTPIYNKSCVSLAKYARAVAIMRDLGIKIEDIDTILKKTPDIPTGAMKRLVYSRGENDPSTTNSTFLRDCTLAGYESTVERLRIEEVAYNFQERKTTKNERNR